MTAPVDAIKSTVQSVTKDWAKQRKAEERDRNAAFNRRTRLIPSYRVTLREAAFEVMEEAYLAASDAGSLPVKPRQIMYAARPKILTMTGDDELSDSYFSQTLLIDYMEEHDCSDWDIIWDARGHFIEPHTGIETALGTLEVRQYLGERPSFGPVHVAPILSFPTNGPKNRFGNILFIEKEGFHPILRAAQLQERFDVALMSTKGMSVTAARKLLDELSPHVENIFVLHDFDRSGFSICGTLGTDSRRYKYVNNPPIVDIGLRLAEAIDMNLESEPVPRLSEYEWRQRAETLRGHGATPQEVEFLRDRRVELNAMTSRQFVDFIEARFAEHGVKKVIPDYDVIAEALNAPDLAERCEIVGGDFFASVPSGGDAYILSRVIHDWDDTAALKILSNCRRAMRSDGRLLLIEGVAKPPNEPDPNKFLDVWFIGGGGCERTEAEYKTLLGRAGVRLTRVVPIGGSSAVLEGRPE